MLLRLVGLALVWATHAEVGWNINFGYMENPPPVADGIAKIKQMIPQWNYSKTFDYNATVLQALNANGIRNMVVGIPNSDLERVGTSGDPLCETIVEGLRYLYDDGVQLTIAVGNEPTLATYGTAYSPWVYPALLNVRSVLSNKYMNNVKLTVPFDSGILGSSYPPSQGTLSTSAASVVVTVAHFLKNEGSPFTVNLYPFFALVDNPNDISVEYATLQTSLTASDGITYPNMLAAMVAAVRAALLAQDSILTEDNLPIIVGETGWPTAGNTYATVANAQTFVNNALASGISLYAFEAYDEKLKAEGSGSGSGSTSTVEPNWGWMSEEGIPKYPIVWPTPAETCDTRFPPNSGEFLNLNCPYGTLQAWLQSGGCIQDSSCSLIYCPDVPKATVLATCG
eukprot:GGOE01042231.1.p1 GENE.GGOE01042231.1~~GGOE01042231.1.p1  ORF type:complete len:397 (-),score=61.52 GGOE01042231.1:305-1495(-)